MMTIAVLMTCHNRRKMTLRCLHSLAEALNKVWKAGEAMNCHVFLVDDGSTDGTCEAILKYVKEMERSDGEHRCIIHIVSGDGTLFWAKGMALAWRESLKNEESFRTAPRSLAYTHFLWLNDDVLLESDALERVRKMLLSAQRADSTIIVGELQNARGEIVYGLQSGIFTGNFVLVPRGVYEKVGIICSDYNHAWADSDYALRCRRVGVLAVSCGVVGQCEGHPIRPSLKGLPLRNRVQMLLDPKGWNVHDLWLYRKRNWGLCAAIISCVHLIVHVLIGERR